MELAPVNVLSGKLDNSKQLGLIMLLPRDLPDAVCVGAVSWTWLQHAASTCGLTFLSPITICSLHRQHARANRGMPFAQERHSMLI